MIGLVPGLGDLVTAAVSLLVLWAAVRYRVPIVIVGRMLLNIGIDLVIGIVPVFGDIGDVFFQSNTRNLELLKRHVREGRPPRAIDHLIVWGAAAVILFSAAACFWGAWQIVRWVFRHPI